MEAENRAKRMLESMGYKGEGGLGKRENSSTIIVKRVHERRGKDRRGVYVMGVENPRARPKLEGILQPMTWEEGGIHNPTVRAETRKRKKYR